MCSMNAKGLRIVGNCLEMLVLSSGAGVYSQERLQTGRETVALRI